MKVILTKRIVLKCATTYLKLLRRTENKDIQNYINGNKRFENNPIIANGVKRYLKKIGILDDQGELTPEGKNVKETGRVKVYEEGKYIIYYTENDSYFGNKIFFLRRQQPYPPSPNYQPDFKPLSLEIKRHFCLSSSNNDEKSFHFNLISSNVNCYGIEKNCNTKLTFSWKWEELKSSLHTFNGQIDGYNFTANNNEFPCNDDLSKYINEILNTDWDSENKRYKISFNSVENTPSVSSFECTYSNGKWKDFIVNIDRLPIEPYNDEEAVIWRNKLINMELEKEYMHPDKYEETINNINKKDGFSAYSEKFDVPNRNEYIEKLEPKQKSKRGLEYWHLVAPLDLNVDIPQVLINFIT